MKIHDVEQRSPEWFEVRRGLVTASSLKDVMSKGRGAEPSKTRLTYLRKLVGEIVSGQPMENFTTAAMERGIVMEAEAREWYALSRDVEPELVGFCESADPVMGASPDALIGEDGLLEIKTAAAHIMVEHLSRDPETPPPEHVLQVQGQLLVTGRAWCDLVIYWPGMPVYVHRCHADRDVQRDITDAVTTFNRDLDALVEKVRSYA